MLAVCLAGAEASEVRIKVLDEEHVEYNKHKYRLYMRCSAAGSQSLSVFMRIRYFQPLQCTEADLHPVAFPPPLSQGLFYGPLLIVDGGIGDFSLAQWQQAWDGMQNHRWSMSHDMSDDSDQEAEEQGNSDSAEEEDAEAEDDESDSAEEEEDTDEDSEEDDSEEEDSEEEASGAEDSAEDSAAAGSDEDVEEPPPELVVCKDLPPSKRQRRYDARLKRNAR